MGAYYIRSATVQITPTGRARARLLRKPSQKPVRMRRWCRLLKYGGNGYDPRCRRVRKQVPSHTLTMAGRWLLTISDKEQGAENIIRQIHITK